MKSYPLLISGHDEPGSGWNYVLRASAFLRDPAGTFELKRRLELGEAPESDAANEAVVGRCAWGGPGENRRAVASAARAASEYAAFPEDVRLQMGLDFNTAIRERAAELVEILIAEGHPRRLAEWEVRGILDGSEPSTLRWYFDQMRQELTVGDRRVVLRRRPDGVVCLNPPQNAAASNSALGLGALLAGNALVVKAPRSTPLGVMFLFRDVIWPVLRDHGAPDGTLSVISGDTRQILRQWRDDPQVNDLFFFGDSDVGLKLGADFVASGKKAILELAGNDGFVVWRDADLDSASMALVESFFGSSQICMVPKHAVVHPAIADEFAARVVSRVSELRPGFPEDPEVLLSPVLKTDRFFEFLAEATTRGAIALCGGEALDVRGKPSSSGWFLEPTLLRIDGFAMAGGLRCVTEETFFPLLPLVVPQESRDEEMLTACIEFLNGNEYGLRNSLWSSSDHVIERFENEVTGGGLLKINDSHIGFSPPLATHGGNKRTGGPYG